MKTYTRTEQRLGYQIITVVNEAGQYRQISMWPDGAITGEYITTLNKMGWASLPTFLNARHGFQEAQGR